MWHMVTKNECMISIASYRVHGEHLVLWPAIQGLVQTESL